MSEKQSEGGRGRRKSRLPSQSPIDNKTYASTATPAPATPYLRPPPTLRRSSTTRTRSESPSASTNLTHPSSQKRLKATPKTTRKQLYCPDCGTAIKNGFEKHFHKHLQYLFPQNTLGESDLIGCGYCSCEDPELDHGKAFHGVTALVRHIHEEHTQADSPAPVRLQWDVNLSFKNILSGEVSIRRHFLSLVKEENRRIASKTPPYNIPPILSWPQSEDTRHLLDELQTLGGRIVGVPFTHIRTEDEYQLNDLLLRAYEAAHKWQPKSTLTESAQPHRPALALPLHPPPHQIRPVPSPSQVHFAGTEDTLNFTAIGHGAFDASQYPSFTDHQAAVKNIVRPRKARPVQQSRSNHRDPIGDVEPNEAAMFPKGPLETSSNPQYGSIPVANVNTDTYSGTLDNLDAAENDMFRQFTIGLGEFETEDSTGHGY
jgi:hypothetical protein